mmetsp:Transcript_82543/g.220621  ORF Transcript_82543/g.220621 Transcript_82543/m.220621 type:complete len:241 (+) Transcript_82543:433-1155(+)
MMSRNQPTATRSTPTPRHVPMRPCAQSRRVSQRAQLGRVTKALACKAHPHHRNLVGPSDKCGPPGAGDCVLIRTSLRRLPPPSPIAPLTEPHGLARPGLGDDFVCHAQAPLLRAPCLTTGFSTGHGSHWHGEDRQAHRLRCPEVAIGSALFCWCSRDVHLLPAHPASARLPWATRSPTLAGCRPLLECAHGGSAVAVTNYDQRTMPMSRHPAAATGDNRPTAKATPTLLSNRRANDPVRG